MRTRASRIAVMNRPGSTPSTTSASGKYATGSRRRRARRTIAISGRRAWFGVRARDGQAQHAAWQHTDLPAHAAILRDRVAFAWRTMDAFYEEDERIVGHAADLYHRIDMRQTSRHLVVRDGDRVVAETRHPVALYESGFAPRWYVPRDKVDAAALTPVEGQTFCPYKGLATYHDIGERKRAAWSYEEAWPEVGTVSGWMSFEPDIVDVYLDDRKLTLEPGQAVVPHGIDRDLDPDELRQREPSQS
jgi:uncharacterized protein (DUF427 family)